MHMCNKSKWLTKLNYCKCKINNVHSTKIVYNLPGQFVQPKPKLFRQSAVLIGKCPMSDHYFKHWHMYLYIHTCICTYIHMYVCVYMYLYIHTYVCMYVRMYNICMYNNTWIELETRIKISHWYIKYICIRTSLYTWIS